MTNEQKMRQIAREQINHKFKRLGIIPKESDTFTFRAGFPDEYTLTMDQLIERQLKLHGDIISALAGDT